MDFLYELPALTDDKIADFWACGGEKYFGPNPYFGPLEVQRLSEDDAPAKRITRRGRTDQ